MGTIRKIITVTDRQDKWIKAQIMSGDFTNDSEYIRDLIRCDQARSSEIDAIRGELIKGEQSGEPQPFDGGRFKEKMLQNMPEKSAEYWLTPEAERDMEAIWLYTLEAWGFEQANRYIDELTEAFGQLAANPKMAVSCDHIRKGYRHSQVGRLVIYCWQTDYGIALIRILYDRMLPTPHL